MWPITGYLALKFQTCNSSHFYASWFCGWGIQVRLSCSVILCHVALTEVTWYLVGWWAGLVWRVGDSFTQKSSTSVGMGRRLNSAGSWLSANAGLTSMGGVRGEREKEGRRGRRGEGSRDQTLMGNLLLEETLHLLFVTTSLSCLIRSSPGPLNYQRLSWWPCVVRNALGLGKSVSSWAKGPHSKAIIYYHWDIDQINLTFLTTPSCCLGHKRGQENQNYWCVKEGKLRNVSFSRLGTDSRHQP